MDGDKMKQGDKVIIVAGVFFGRKATILRPALVPNEVYLKVGNLEIIKDIRSIRPYMRQWNDLECWIMNLIDYRYWFCECHYQSPYGPVVMAGCPKHD